ncbi:MAG: ferritin [Candidatus Aminicenantes bacterium]|nr:ferritin [Candidatus Aminicenantes bacterium]
MIKVKIQDALNKQLNAELYSSYLYLSMAAYFESVSLKGFANWMQVQAREELVHAMKFYGYIHESGGRVTLTSISAPLTQWDSALEVFKQVYQHEQKVTGLINNLVTLAVSEADHATNNFLQWFIAEQVEEESSADEIVQKLRLLGEDRSGLFMLDQELGQRVFTAPVAVEGE